MEKTPEKEGYSIGEVADLLQVATSKLRHWEAMDLFSVEKQPNHYRCYDMADVVNIAEVLTYRELGFPISRIEEMRRALNWHEIAECEEDYDLIVAGGGKNAKIADILAFYIDNGMGQKS